MGDGTEESAKEPKKVNALETEFLKSVSCGAHSTAAVAEPRENDGTISKSRLWVWGQNQVCLNIYTSEYVLCILRANLCDKNTRLLHDLFRGQITLAYSAVLLNQTR